MRTIFITDSPQESVYVATSGVDIIMIDLEVIGKHERQGHLDTLISAHDIKSISNISETLSVLCASPELLVRVNPLYDNSLAEINECISRGATSLMLPMFSSSEDVNLFLDMVDGRVPVILLLETPAALVRLNSILEIDHPFDVHIGLNDLHLGLQLDFMFELVSYGIVEQICSLCKQFNRNYGFGGVARLTSDSLLSPRDILSAHVALDSSSVILSRDWRNSIINHTFPQDLLSLREYLSNPLPYQPSSFFSKVQEIARSRSLQ